MAKVIMRDVLVTHCFKGSHMRCHIIIDTYTNPGEATTKITNTQNETRANPHTYMHSHTHDKPLKVSQTHAFL